MDRVVKLVLGILILISSALCGQEDPLNRRISIKLAQVSTSEAIKTIAQKGRFLLSYNASGIDEQKLTSVNAQNKTVRFALEQALGSGYTFRSGGSHVIIIPKTQPKTEHRKELYVLSGQIKDAATGKTISSASITEVGEYNSTLSDKQGKYTLPINPETDYARILISRKNYRDTVLVLKPEEVHAIEIQLRPLPIISELNPLPASIPIELADNGLFQAVVSEEQQAFSENHPFYENRTFQVSFLPTLGSNRNFSGMIENHLSLNLLGGYSMALSGVELGGVFNITRKHVKGLQISGLMNITGGEVDGVQIAGFMNNNIGAIRGVQTAGFYNLSMDSLRGVQAAGFFNMARNRVRGVQAAGFMNISGKDLSGVQAAGFMNLCGKSGHGSQFAGFANIATGDMYGLQTAGFLNLSTGSMHGAQLTSGVNITVDTTFTVQVAGIANFARWIKGSQVSTLFNIGGKVGGSQLGLVNVCDTIKGISVGFISIVRKGMHQFEISTSDVNQVLFTLRTGTHRFYNVISTGMFRPEDPSFVTFGYGAGTEFRPGKKFYFGIDLVGSMVFNESLKLNVTPDLWGRSGLYLGYRPSKRIGFFAGPTFNVYRIDDSNSTGNRPAIGRDELFATKQGTSSLSGWIGWQAGIRLF